MIVGGIVTILMLAFVFSNVPDLKNEEECKVDASGANIAVKPLFQRSHFVFAVVAQFFYVAAQTGVFSYFVNYIHSDTPALSEGMAKTLPANMTALTDGVYHITDRGAGELLSFGAFGLFLLGRFTGSFALRIFKAHSMLALYSIANALMMILVMFPLGWLSVAGLFLSFFFMSITYPTIFALGIHGLGEQTKKAASFIVMAIVGGAIMPLFMGWLADKWGMRVGFLMPLICFVVIAAYGLLWKNWKRATQRNNFGQEIRAARGCNAPGCFFAVRQWIFFNPKLKSCSRTGWCRRCGSSQSPSARDS